MNRWNSGTDGNVHVMMYSVRMEEDESIELDI